MLKIYNELLRINHPIGTSFVCGFQLTNKKSLYYIGRVCVIEGGLFGELAAG
jgi:hypothetical protein